MNVWLINECLPVDLLESVLKPEYLQKAMFIILLDLTKVSKFI